MSARFLLALIAPLLLSACGIMLAPSPLFTVADQVGPPPLTEGIWIAIGAECPAHNVRRRGRFPPGCAPTEIRRLPDGAWQSQRRFDLVNPRDDERPEPERFLIVSAVERVTPDQFAPLYIAETPRGEGDAVYYIVVVPIGALPMRAFAAAAIDCNAITRDGVFEGLDPGDGPPYGGPVPEGAAESPPAVAVEQPELTPSEPAAADGDDPEIGRRTCAPLTQAAVREAARRTIVEGAGRLLEERDSDPHIVWARPLDR